MSHGLKLVNEIHKKMYLIAKNFIQNILCNLAAKESYMEWYLQRGY